jgi:predicted ester cyclase
VIGGRFRKAARPRPLSSINDLRFTVEVGPIVAGETVAGRWVAEGTYQGGIPGSTAPTGTRVRFHGNDIWRAEDGLIREYWLSDDLLDLLQQLGVVPSAEQAEGSGAR